MLHDKLVDAVIDNFLEHDINAIIGMRSIAKSPDVHPRAQPDVRQRIERLDAAFVVLFCHKLPRRPSRKPEMRISVNGRFLVEWIATIVPRSSWEEKAKMGFVYNFQTQSFDKISLPSHFWHLR